MKIILALLMLAILCSCGIDGTINQPITTPTVFPGNQKTVRYNVMNGLPKTCYATILVGGTAISSSSYSVECEYNNSNEITAFLVTYYISLPGLATLQYSIY